MIPARQEVIEAFAREEYARHFSSANEQPPLGVMEVVRLMDKREFIFRGRAYRVPPVPWRVAAEMLDCKEELRTLADDAPLSEIVRVFERAARLSRKVCRPAGFVRRILWPLTPNPFRKATPWQVGKNLGFFSMCIGLDQTQQSENLELPKAERPRPGTYRRTSPASSNGSLRGRIARASRSRGVTS